MGALPRARLRMNQLGPRPDKCQSGGVFPGKRDCRPEKASEGRTRKRFERTDSRVSNLLGAAVADEDPVRVGEEDTELEFDSHPAIFWRQTAEVADVGMAEVDFPPGEADLLGCFRDCGHDERSESCEDGPCIRKQVARDGVKRRLRRFRGRFRHDELLQVDAQRAAQPLRAAKSHVPCGDRQGPFSARPWTILSIQRSLQTHPASLAEHTASTVPSSEM